MAEFLPECWPPAKENTQKSAGGKLIQRVLHEDWFKWDKITKVFIFGCFFGKCCFLCLSQLRFLGLTRACACVLKPQAEFLKTEILLGITICFAQVPESVAFAFMAHIKPPVALHAAWVVGLICTLFGGRSGMVNGAEGAFAAIISTMVAVPETQGGNGVGIELLFPSVMCAGLIMLIIWAVGGDRFITLMAASIMDGFCCGLAIVIGLSQLHPFQIGHGEHMYWRPANDPTTWFMVLIMICSMLTMELVPKIPYKAAKLIPSSLLAILVAILLEYAIVRNIPCEEAVHAEAHRLLASSSNSSEPHSGKCSTQVIGDVTPFTFTTPYPFFLNEDYLSADGTYAVTADQAGTIIIQGLLLAIAGVVQGLMTTEVVTSYVKTPAHTPSIVWSMGAANLISGFFGGMGGDAMIGLSTINCLNGGKGRLAPTVTAVGVMLCTMVAYPVLDFIPIASLAGVMIVVVLHTFKWAKVPMIISACLPAAARKPINGFCQCNCFPKWLQLPEEVDRWEALIIVVVSILTIMFNLVVGVGVGLVLACFRFTYCQSLATNVLVKSAGAADAPKRYAVQGKLFFGSAMRFHTFFDVDNDPSEVVLELPEKPTEYSAVDALSRVTALYRAQQKTLTIEIVAADGGESAMPAVGDTPKTADAAKPAVELPVVTAEVDATVNVVQ